MKAIVTVPEFDKETAKHVPSLGIPVIRWIQENLLQPDGADAGEPMKLTAEQRRFLLWFYALNEDGSFRYRRAVLRRAKGWGKSPFIGAVSLAELCGPVRFSHWGADGKPVGKTVGMPWVVVAGVSESQTENTLAAVRAMAENSPLNQDNGGPLDIGISRILVKGGGKLHAITASAKSQEGARWTFAVADEPHHWTKSNGGHNLAEVMRRNLAKMNNRLLETTNAHEPGQESTAEKSWLAYVAQREGKTPRQEILYDCREAPPLTPEQLVHEPTLREALTVTYGDSHWVNLDNLIGEIYDPSTRVDEARRFYLNQIVSAADAWLDAAAFVKNVKDDVPPLEDGQTITLGFDGSLTDDSTALVGVRMDDGAPFLLGLWEKPDGAAGEGWSVDKEAVRGVVDWAFSTYDVVAFFSDVRYWETDVTRWRSTYGEKLLIKATPKDSVGWDMSAHLRDNTNAAQELHRAFVEGEVPFTPDDRFQRHILNARRRLNNFGVSFGKDSPESPRKIDALAALLLARMARGRLLTDPAWAKRRRRTGRAGGFR